MKVTVDLSESDMKDICRVTGERKKGPAIRKLVVDALTMRRREEIAQHFISGKWGVALSGFEGTRKRERNSAHKRAARWRS